MRTLLLSLMLLLPTSRGFAQEVCVEFDTSAWTPEQKNWRQGTAYRLAFEAGQNLIPTVDEDRICFTDPTFDVPTVITAQTMLARMARQKADNNAEAARIEASKISARNKLRILGLTEQEIEALRQ